MMATTHMNNMMTKPNNSECCMCGDLGLSHLLFRCVVCHFRSQHRYCSNLYPKAESYKVCNWCLISKDNVDGDQQHNNINISSVNNSDYNKNKMSNNHHSSGPSPKCFQPTSPIKKPTSRSPRVQARSPSSRKKTITSNSQAHDREDGNNIIRSSSSKWNRSKSKLSLNIKSTKKKSSDDDNKKGEKVYVSKKSESGREANGGVIKHVFKNKVRRYKLLAEVSC